jgi:hypothetical protein
MPYSVNGRKGNHNVALNVAKVTFAFTQGSYGWTENYFLAGPSSTLQAELTKANALAAKRAPLSGSQTKIAYIKVSNELNLRDVLVSNDTYNGYPSETSDAPDTAILFKRYTVDPSANAPLYMRGVWDSLIINGGIVDAGNAAWLALRNSWQGLLTSAGWGFLGKDPAASGSAAINSVAQNVDGTLHYVLKTPVLAAIPVGTKIKCFVSGVQGALSANGPFVVTVASTTTCDTIVRIPTFAYVTGGKFSFTQPKFFPIGNCQIQRVVERKVGRPLYVSRGRRKGRKLG